MSGWELAGENLTSAPVLAFALGFVVAVARADVKLPSVLYDLLSIYLLLAIGLKGGAELRAAEAGEVWGPAVATLVVGVLVPIVVYGAALAALRCRAVDAAALAAHYGSVSVVTFTAAATFVTAAGLRPEGFLAALVALLEVPGIIVALLIAMSRGEREAPWSETLREVLLGRSVVLLGGGVLIGFISGPSGFDDVAPFFSAPFKGVLVLFLLEMGIVCGRRVADGSSLRLRLVAFGILAPVVLGSIGAALGILVGLDVGGATVFGAMVGSASYIAAPAAVRIALPEADPGIYVTASLAVTFPFNLTLGIPLYYAVANAIG